MKFKGEYREWCDHIWYEVEYAKNVKNQPMYFVLGYATILAIPDWWYPKPEIILTYRVSKLSSLMNVDRIG